MTACATTNQRLAVLAVRCGDAIPAEYRAMVKGVTGLGSEATIADLAEKLDGQTAKLDQANGRAADLIAMIDQCDARNEEIVKELTPKKRFGVF